MMSQITILPVNIIEVFIRYDKKLLIPLNTPIFWETMLAVNIPLERIIDENKIENGKVSSPVSTLFTIAKALNTKITYFFSDQDENLPIILVRKNERRQFHRINARFGYTYEALGYKRKEKLMEPFILYMDKKSEKTLVFLIPAKKSSLLWTGRGNSNTETRH
jgi:transcriptional regulator with XRE-family HTH domain